MTVLARPEVLDVRGSLAEVGLRLTDGRSAPPTPAATPAPTAATRPPAACGLRVLVNGHRLRERYGGCVDAMRLQRTRERSQPLLLRDHAKRVPDGFAFTMGSRWREHRLHP